MAPTLTKQQQSLVDSKRMTTRPSVYDPNSDNSTTITRDMEQWLILTSKSVKSQAISWIKEILKSESDDTYQNLLKETLDAEAASLSVMETDLGGATSAFTTWRKDPQISGYEDVTEIGWLFQELQQGVAPYEELAQVKHAERFVEAVSDRFAISKESTTSRKARLNTWIAVLNSY